MKESTVVDLRSRLLEKKLSPLQVETALAIYSGISNKDLAKKYGIKIDALKNRISQCYRKLGLKNRSQLIIYIFRLEKALKDGN